MGNRDLGECAICGERVFGSQPICFGCYCELDAQYVQDDTGAEYTASSYEYDGSEEE